MTSTERAKELQTLVASVVAEFDPSVRVHVVRQMYPRSYRIELRLHYSVDAIAYGDMPASALRRAVRLAYLRMATEARERLRLAVSLVGPL